MSQDEFEALLRVWSLDDQTLGQFTLIVEGHTGFYYHAIDRVEHVSKDEMFLHGVGIPCTMTETFYGLAVYDDRGLLVGDGTFEHPRHAVNGDVFNPGHRFYRPYKEGEPVEVQIDPTWEGQ